MWLGAARGLVGIGRVLQNENGEVSISLLKSIGIFYKKKRSLGVEDSNEEEVPAILEAL